MEAHVSEQQLVNTIGSPCSEPSRIFFVEFGDGYHV
jgi:hypothetical protein